MEVLTNYMDKSLKELARGFAGELTMSSGMEKLETALYLGRVPEAWTRLAWASMRTLDLWMADLLKRFFQLNEWCQNPNEIPKVTWLSGLIIPESFLTAIKQVTAQQKSLELDKLVTWTEWTKKMSADQVDGKPRSGTLLVLVLILVLLFLMCLLCSLCIVVHLCILCDGGIDFLLISFLIFYSDFYSDFFLICGCCRCVHEWILHARSKVRYAIVVDGGKQTKRIVFKHAHRGVQCHLVDRRRNRRCLFSTHVQNRISWTDLYFFGTNSIQTSQCEMGLGRCGLCHGRR